MDEQRVLTLARETRSSIELTRNAKGEFLPGPAHHKWKGDEATGENTGRSRAQRQYREMGLCEICGLKSARDRHHLDGNTLNNESSNIQRICRSCHHKQHGRIPPRPDPDTISQRFRGAIPWNKGLTKAIAPQLSGGRRPANG